MSVIKVGEVKICRIKFVWKIRDFSKKMRMLTSSQFPTSAPERLGKWRLEMNPYNTTHGTPYISILLKQETSIECSTRVIFSIMDDKDAVARQDVASYSESGCHRRLADLAFIFNKANGVLPNDELTIVCELEIQLPPVNQSPEKCQPPPSPLVRDLSDLLSSKSLTDVTIVVGGAKLKAHKAVLAARSPVFAAMFTNSMLEKETSVVKITDMDAEVFQAMLEFMYTDKKVSQTTSVHELLAAATKYQIERLRILCEEALCEDLSLDNVLQNLALAELYNAPKLKEQCMSFVMVNRAEVLRSPSWETLKRSHQSLVTEIAENICLQQQNFDFLDHSDEVTQGSLCRCRV